MDIIEFLRQAGEKTGPSGHERQVSLWLKEAFEPYCDSVETDRLFNVIALKKGAGTKSGERIKIMLCAHQDEIALMVTDILPDGTLRMGQVGGVDPRILPASTVTVHGKRPLLGVVGAKPPHLLLDDDRKRNYKREDLFVDVGLPYKRVKSLVSVGDLITLRGDLVRLKNGRVAGRCMDDRACVGIMLQTAELLQDIKHVADVYFVSTVQEEVGAIGAMVSGYAIDPDIGVALDVTHAPTPGSRAGDTVPLDAPALSCGPFVQPKLLEIQKRAAERCGVNINMEYQPRNTGTDCDTLNIVRQGIPCVLIGLPLKYMHTSVELIDTSVIMSCARLAAEFVRGIDEGWDKELWS